MPPSILSCDNCKNHLLPCRFLYVEVRVEIVSYFRLLGTAYFYYVHLHTYMMNNQHQKAAALTFAMKNNALG